MKLSIIIVSLALALVCQQQVSANNDICTPIPQDCGEDWWTNKKNDQGKKLDIVKDKWEDMKDGVKAELQKGNMRNIIASIDVKKNITGLFQTMLPEDVQELVAEMIKAKSVGAILEAYAENPIGFDAIVNKLDSKVAMDLQLIIAFYENVGDFFGTRNPFEMAKEFPRTREQLLLKVVKFGLLKQFPESHAELEGEIEDVVPFIQGIFTEAGDKFPKFKRITQLINFGLTVTDKVTGGAAFKPLEKFISKLDESYDDDEKEAEGKNDDNTKKTDDKKTTKKPTTKIRSG